MAVSYSEESLRAAVILADRLLIATLPSDDQIDHVFSKRFERQMRKLTRKYANERNSTKSWWKKRWIAILAAIIMTITTAMSVSAVRQTVFQFVSQVYEKYSQIFFSQTPAASHDRENFTGYKPS